MLLGSACFLGATMNRLATLIAVAGLIGTPAFAADLGAPPPAPAPVYNWTGWYVGVNAGASMGDANTDFNVSPLSCAGTCVWTFPHSFSDRNYPDGFIGGGQIGYNWQYSPLIVVGLEADFQGAVERDSNYLTNSFSDFVTEASNQDVTNYTTQIDWFGTVRARLGYVWGNGEVLSYVTGGLAYGEVKINGTNTASFACFPGECGPAGAAGSVTQAFSQSHVNTGWVLGYGTEGHLQLPGNWTWKVETLYMDLGHLDSTGVTTGVSSNCPTSPFCVLVPGGQVTTQTHFTDWILRGGLNYRFY
jgi:outer membrane immunogenic protein